MEPTSTDLPDHALLQQAQRGDDRAFAELVLRHGGRLRAVAQRLLHDPDRVDDALQDAYLKAFRNLGRFRRESTVATWLYRITYNTCLDELRRRPSEVGPVEGLDPPSTERGPAERAVARVEAAHVLSRLAPEMRATVVLVHGYGLDHAEVSRILGVPAGTIASRLSRAGSRLRRASASGGTAVTTDAA